MQSKLVLEKASLLLLIKVLCIIVIIIMKIEQYFAMLYCSTLENTLSTHNNLAIIVRYY